MMLEPAPAAAENVVMAIARKTKVCTLCLRRRPLALFPEDARHADGRGSYCRDCAAGRTREWREKSRRNREQQRAWNREYMRRRRSAA